MACSTHKHDKTTAGWGKRKPGGQRERRQVRARCGAGAFAATYQGELKFPLVAKTGSCCLACDGARVAYQRASMHHKRYPGVAAKIRSRAKTAGCAWAQGAPRKRAVKRRRRR